MNHEISSATSTWETVDPGGNGWLIFAAVHPASGHLFFSSDMGFSLYRSKDRGETWEPIANPVTGTPHFVAGDPQDAGTLYMSQAGASPKSSGIWKSSDDGDNWQHIFPSEAFGRGFSQSGLVDPENHQNLYWTVGDLGVWRSKDGGFSWQDISDGLPLAYLRHSEVHSHYLELDRETSPDQRKIYYPTNLGLFQFQEPDGSWKLVQGLPDGICTQVQVCDGGIIYAVFPQQGLFRSRDGGVAWDLIGNGLGDCFPLHLAAVKSQPDIVYVATVRDRGIYKSGDGGQSFELITHRHFNKEHNWPSNYRQHEAVSGMIMLIDPNDPQTLYLDYNKKTHDGGLTWQHYGTKHVGDDRWTGTGLSLLTEYRAVFDPQQPDRVWLGFSDAGLMLSEDGGRSIRKVYSGHRAEVNHVARIRDELVFSSGSCVSIAVDPDIPTTIYASINGKNADCRASVGGAIIKSVNGGKNWTPISEEQGLQDGIVRDIVIDPDSPPENRTVFAASYGNGVFRSSDGGCSFELVTPPEMFAGNTRLMCLRIAPGDSHFLYLGVGGSYGIRPITVGPQGYPLLKPEQYGGVYKSIDKGQTWQKQNATRELPSVIDLVVHPSDPNIVYAAVYSDNFLVPEDSNHPDWREGGVYKTENGGQSWEKIFSPPSDEMMGKGEVEAICLNPLVPDILYAAIRYYGVFRSVNGGKTWETLGQESMDRKQKRFHSICVNPHDPFEVWLAHFGASFSKCSDPAAREILTERFGHTNFVRNPGFNELDEKGEPLHWKIRQPDQIDGELQVVSISNDQVYNGDNSVRFHLSPAYTHLPSRIPAFREQQRLEKEGSDCPDQGWKKVMDELGSSPTSAWLNQKIDPYFTSLMRGREVLLEMDVYLVHWNPSGIWERWYEMCEVPRCAPQVFLSEVRDFNIHWVVAETSLEDEAENCGSIGITGRWVHCQASGRVSENAFWTEVTVSGIGPRDGATDLYVDNIKLTLLEDT